MLMYLSCRSVRVSATEQFLMMATKCCTGQRPLIFFITLLFTVLSVSQIFSCYSINNLSLTRTDFGTINVEKHQEI